MSSKKKSHNVSNIKIPKELYQISSLPGNFYWKDIDGTYRGCNKNFLELLALKSADEIYGKTDLELWPHYSKELSDNDLLVIKNKKAMCFEETLKAPNGEQMYFISMKSPWFDDDNNLIGVIGNSVDISNVMRSQFLLRSEKEIAEKRSSEALQHLNNIVACVPGSIYWKNKDSVYIGCNDYMVLVAGMQSKNDIIGKNDFELWPQQAEALVANDKEVIQSGKSIEVEEWVVLPNGEHRFFTVVKMPLKDDQGNIVGIIGNSLDVTELKQTKEQLSSKFEELDEAYKSRNKFIYVASHEIRGPISNAEYVIDRMLNIYKMLPNNDIELVEILQHSYCELDHTLSSVDYLIKLFTSNTEKYNKDFATIDTVSLLKEKLSEKVKLNPFKFELHINEDVKLINTNLFALREILDILIDNSIRFSDASLIINIFVALEDNKLVIRFSDNGKGISQGALNNMFISQLGKDGKSEENFNYHNPAIRLTYVKHLLKPLNGAMEIHSQEGQGTTVLLKLPVTNSVIAQSANIVKSNAIRQEKISYRLLLVEDNNLTRKFEANIFKQVGFAVDSVESGADAIEIIKKNKYDVFALDISLPDMNGIMLMNTIKTHISNDAVFAAVTSHSSEDDIDKFYNEGFAIVLIKPLKVDDVINFYNEIKIIQSSIEND